MSLDAHVTLVDNRFRAVLADGAELDAPDFRQLALALHRAGVPVSGLRFAWCPGQRMITAGVQVALRAELDRLARAAAARPVAA